MPLKLSLAKGEKFIVNGAVIKNDGPDISLVFENKANILRQKDIMTSETANTPARRVYLALQCAYMFGEGQDKHVAEFENLLGEFAEAAPSAEAYAQRMRAMVAGGDLYGALKECRAMIDYEAEIFSHVQ